ncbi:MAG: Ig-like domain-containing protein, partial [Leifsonia sp.]
STTTLTSDRSTLKAGTGQSALLTAKVAVDGAPATGRVEFLVDGAVVSTATLSNGSASYRLAAAATAGSHQVVAHYLGTDEVGASTSDPVTVATVPIAVTLTLHAAPTTVRQNGLIPAIFLVTAVPDAVKLPNGTVEIREGATVIARVRMLAGVVGLATLPRGQSIGVHHYTAVFTPDDPGVFGTATSNPVTVTVTR